MARPLAEPALDSVAGELRTLSGKAKNPRPGSILTGILLAALFLAPLLAGCKSTPKTPSNRLASVIVKERSREEIDGAIRAVFEKHGYDLARRRDQNALVFEKKGTFMNGFMYGDWYSGGVWERVKVYRGALESGKILIDCDAYMVQEPEDPFFQTEKKSYKSRRHIYQNLLNEVADALGGEKS